MAVHPSRSPNSPRFLSDKVFHARRIVWEDELVCHGRREHAHPRTTLLLAPVPLPSIGGKGPHSMSSVSSPQPKEKSFHARFGLQEHDLIPALYPILLERSIGAIRQ